RYETHTHTPRLQIVSTSCLIFSEVTASPVDVSGDSTIWVPPSRSSANSGTPFELSVAIPIPRMIPRPTMIAVSHARDRRARDCGVLDAIGQGAFDCLFVIECGWLVISIIAWVVLIF